MKDMVRWLERAVIGLNLCPFAKGVHAKGQIHYAVSAATDAVALAQDLRRPRWPPKFPRLWPPQTPPPELIGDRG